MADVVADAEVPAERVGGGAGRQPGQFRHQRDGSLTVKGRFKILGCLGDCLEVTARLRLKCQHDLDTCPLPQIDKVRCVQNQVPRNGLYAAVSPGGKGAGHGADTAGDAGRKKPGENFGKAVRVGKAFRR
jgi:hypothetical protein